MRSLPPRSRSLLRPRRRRGCPLRSPGHAGDRAAVKGRPAAGTATCSWAFLPVVYGTFPFSSTNLELLCREPADSLAIRSRRPRELARRLAEGARHRPRRETGPWDLDPEAATGSRTGLAFHAPAVSGHERG